MKKTLLTTAAVVVMGLASFAQNADVLKSDAISAESQEQYADAARFFEEAHLAYQAANTLDTVCVYRAGSNYLKINQYDKAAIYLEQALALNYNPGRTSRMLADAYLGSKQNDKAEATLVAGKEATPEEAIEFDKKLAYLYFNSGQYQKSASTFGALNEAIPGNSNYMYLYAFSLERTKKYGEALEVLKSMQESYPDDKRAKKLYAVTYFEKTDAENDAVVKGYEANKGAKLEDYVGTKRRLEEITAHYEKSRVMLEESLADYPTDQMVIASLYKVYKKQGKETQAEAMRKKLP